MSQMDGKAREIEGHTYRVRMLDPMVASDLLVDIGKVIAPALGAIGGFALGEKDGVSKLLEGDGNGSGETVVGSAFERGVVGFVDRLEKQKLREIVETMARATALVVGPQEEPELWPLFNAHFGGRLVAMYKWLAFALEVQYADFFLAIGPAIGRAARSAGLDRSSSPST
jgi:hypothetical protein